MEHHITVQRTARYHTAGSGDSRATEIWLGCHGYAQLAERLLNRMRVLDDGTRLLAAPEGLSRFYVEAGAGQHGPEHRVGASWMTREDRLAEISDYVKYLDVVLASLVRDIGSGTPRIVALGFSQGAATVSRWAAFGDTGADVLVLWGSGVPPDLDLETHAGRLQRTRIFLVRGDADQWYSSEALSESRDRLAAVGIPSELLTYDGGHHLDEGTLRAIAGRIAPAG